jgi:hypothetical protein
MDRLGVIIFLGLGVGLLMISMAVEMEEMEDRLTYCGHHVDELVDHGYERLQWDLCTKYYLAIWC